MRQEQKSRFGVIGLSAFALMGAIAGLCIGALAIAFLID